MSERARRDIELGNKYPYDASDEWWSDSKSPPPGAVDWAHVAARGVLHNLEDRGGVGNELSNVDVDTKQEIVRTVADIIRTAKSINVDEFINPK